jgi:hypothetical protein
MYALGCKPKKNSEKTTATLKPQQTRILSFKSQSKGVEFHAVLIAHEWQNHKAADAKVIGFHPCMHNSNKTNRFLVVERTVASHSGTELFIQIVTGILDSYFLA